jgi:heat shock protein HtpX
MIDYTQAKKGGPFIMAKRIFVFLALNMAIVLTISFILQLFHVGNYLQAYGIDYTSLAIFCLVWGMGGAVISLLLSRQMAKWMMNVRVIQPHLADSQALMVYKMVENLAQKAHLPEIPEVGIYKSNTPNAFATGPSKRRALVAVSTGLIQTLSHEELEAVLGHEISHIANGDMVTMTLLQGVVNAFVMFLARILAFALSGLGGRDKEGKGGSYGSYMLFTFLFEILFMLIGSMIVAYFSRRREFRADKGSAELLGKEPMIHALQKLQRLHPTSHDAHATESPSIAALMIIKSPNKRNFFELFSTHPPLDVRIEHLRQLRT